MARAEHSACLLLHEPWAHYSRPYKNIDSDVLAPVHLTQSLGTSTFPSCQGWRLQPSSLTSVLKVRCIQALLGSYLQLLCHSQICPNPIQTHSVSRKYPFGVMNDAVLNLLGSWKPALQRSLWLWREDDLPGCVQGFVGWGSELPVLWSPFHPQLSFLTLMNAFWAVG